MSSPEPPPVRHSRERAVLTCPNRGEALSERKCKFVCPGAGCGYYMSCADDHEPSAVSR